MSLPVQGARGGGSGLGGGFSSIDTVLDTTYGGAALARLVLVAVVVPTLWAATRSALALVGAVPVAVGVLVTFARSGHRRWGAPLADRRGRRRPLRGGRRLDRRSARAGDPAPAPPAVATVAVTGSVQAWRELRSLDAFFDTTYGRWILVKIAGLVCLLALAEFGRRRVQAMNPVPPLVGASLGAALADNHPPVDDVGQLRRSVGIELALAAAVLAATSALVVTTPGEGGQAAEHAADGHHPPTAGPTTASVELPNDVRVDVMADPATAGSAVLTLTIRSLTGDLVDPPEVGVVASLAEAGIAPVTLTPVRAGAGRFTVDGAPMLLAGTWKITVTVRTTETDASVGSVEIPLAPA